MPPAFMPARVLRCCSVPVLLVLVSAGSSNGAGGAGGGGAAFRSGARRSPTTRWPSAATRSCGSSPRPRCCTAASSRWPALTPARSAATTTTSCSTSWAALAAAFFAMWKNGMTDEDSTGQRLLYSRLPDAVRWTPPYIFLPNLTTPGHALTLEPGPCIHASGTAGSPAGALTGSPAPPVPGLPWARSPNLSPSRCRKEAQRQLTSAPCGRAPRPRAECSGQKSSAPDTRPRGLPRAWQCSPLPPMGVRGAAATLGTPGDPPAATAPTTSSPPAATLDAHRAANHAPTHLAGARVTPGSRQAEAACLAAQRGQHLRGARARAERCALHIGPGHPRSLGRASPRCGWRRVAGGSGSGSQGAPCAVHGATRRQPGGARLAPRLLRTRTVQARTHPPLLRESAQKISCAESFLSGPSFQYDILVYSLFECFFWYHKKTTRECKSMGIRVGAGDGW